MKIEVIKGKIGDHGVGEVIEADNDKAADRLIKLGYAKISNDEGGNGESKSPPPADKRAALEQKALELGIGTADEIKALPDNELGAKIGAAQRQSLINKAVEAKLGTAEEVARLSNKELEALLGKAGVTI